MDHACEKAHPLGPQINTCRPCKQVLDVKYITSWHLTQLHQPAVTHQELLSHQSTAASRHRSSPCFSQLIFQARGLPWLNCVTHKAITVGRFVSHEAVAKTSVKHANPWFFHSSVLKQRALMLPLVEFRKFSSWWRFHTGCINSTSQQWREANHIIQPTLMHSCILVAATRPRLQSWQPKGRLQGSTR